MALRALVVDDDGDILEVVRACLERSGRWEVLMARSGREGLAAAAAAQPDVILLDVRMPDMDGPTTFRHLKGNPATAHVPIILLTATVHLTDPRSMADFGVTAVITKPFDALRLASQVEEALGCTSTAAKSSSPPEHA